MGARAKNLVLFALAEFVILEAMLVAAILYWPNFEGNVDALRALAAPIPAVRGMLDRIEETGIFGYLVGQHFFKGCNTLGAAAAVLFAAGAVAGEVHRGTLEILLARPFSRARILTVRYAGGLAALLVPVFVSTATIPPLTTLVGEDQPLGPYLLGAVHEAIFLAALYSVTFLFSTVGSNPNRISIWVLFATTLEFAIYMVKVVTHTSLFRLADIDVFVAIRDRGALDPLLVLPLGAVSALTLAASLLAFRRRVP